MRRPERLLLLAPLVWFNSARVQKLSDHWSTREPARGSADSGSLLAAHYDEFCKVAGRVLNGDAATLRLEPADLAHEAILRLAAFDRVKFQNREHLLGFSALVMRQVLIDEVRKHKAAKRQRPVACETPAFPDGSSDRLSFLQQALQKLAVVAPDHAQLVSRRYFGGLTLEEIAGLEGVSVRTIKRRWCAARDWLAAEMSDQSGNNLL